MPRRRKETMEMDARKERQLELDDIDWCKRGIVELGERWMELSPREDRWSLYVGGRFFGRIGRSPVVSDWSRAFNYVVERIVDPYVKKAGRAGLRLSVACARVYAIPVVLYEADDPWNIIARYGEPGDLPTKEMLEEAGREIDKYVALKSVAEQVDKGEIGGLLCAGGKKYSFTLKEIRVWDPPNEGEWN